MVSNKCYMRCGIKCIWYVKESIWYNISVIWDKYISTISPQNVPYLKIKLEIQIENLLYHKMK